MSQAKCEWLKVPFCLGGGAGILAEEPKLFWCRCLQGRSLHCTFLWALLWGLFVSFSSSLTSASENRLCLCVFSTFLWECLTGTTAAVRWLYVFKAEFFCVEASGRGIIGIQESYKMCCTEYKGLYPVPGTKQHAVQCKCSSSCPTDAVIFIPIGHDLAFGLWS